MRAREPFLIGRRTRQGTTVVLVHRPPAPIGPAPIRGPWTLLAVVSAN